MVALQNGLRAGPFAQSLAKTPPRTFTEALARANKYINAEEVMKVKRAEQPDRKEKENEKKKPVAEQKTDYRPSRAPRFWGCTWKPDELYSPQCQSSRDSTGIRG